MPSMRQLTPVLVLLAALAVVPAAHARVVVVATDDGTATLTDVTTNKVVARIPVGGRARGAAVAPDGTRGYVATGRHVAAIDLGAHRVVANVNVPGGVTTLAASGDGQRLYVARRRRPHGDRWWLPRPRRPNPCPGRPCSSRRPFRY